MNKKFQNVYDNVKYKTPMKKMLEAQEAKKKALAEAEKAKKPTRKTSAKMEEV